ncbi:uncharacterized protein LOC6544503 [Drosophila erecta]|uniref:DRBM domain-containing protein n=1 Tax=Drosophila erecta TaxID=7220 RepID=B3NGB6_DROER|nr:uncharacterized protein LOC6544503 [Drosophila erecta]EDV51017.1 uncharacterized protein Dere_GG14132 [Drosophila erecta]
MKDALIPNSSAKEEALADDFQKTSPIDEGNGSAEKQTEKDLSALGIVSSEPIDNAEPEAANVLASRLEISDDKKVSMKTSNPSKQQSKKKNHKYSHARQLLHALTPKDSVMILKDLKGVTIDTMDIKRDHEGKIGARLVVNSMEYRAVGSSVNSARTAACEQALNDIFVAKMKALLAEPERDLGGDEDDLLVKLASYAIHKLFEQWSNPNIDVVALYHDMMNKQRLAIYTVKELPREWKSMHPCAVLNYMSPQSVYKNLGFTGKPPNEIFTMGISVDGNEFEAKGRSKKSIRYKLAILACNKLFGTDFPL